MGSEQSKRGTNKNLGDMPSMDALLQGVPQITFGGAAGYATGVAGRGRGAHLSSDFSLPRPPIMGRPIGVLTTCAGSRVRVRSPPACT